MSFEMLRLDEHADSGYGGFGMYNIPGGYYFYSILEQDRIYSSL